jgi:hypothetical protein
MSEHSNHPRLTTGRRFVVVGNPGSRRVELFDAALERNGYSAATALPWIDFIEGRLRLGDVAHAGDVIRIESPGKDFNVERAILAAGAESVEEGCAFLGRAQLDALSHEKGRILCSRQWYAGFAKLLAQLKREITELPDSILMNDPDDIALMFDKPACHAAMTAERVPVPAALHSVSCYNDLVDKMARAGIRRVFVKLAHGSSGSGLVAYQTDGQRHHACTTVETVNDADGVALYNTRKLRQLTDQREIARLIDALCPHCVHVERWIPKAGMDNMAFDLRVMMIANAPMHVVARLSDTPVTNLHLLNQRRDAATAKAHVGERTWRQAMRTCVAAMRVFPGSLYAGIDLLIAADLKRHAVLEINAFGDLLPGVLNDGLETYDSEIRALPRSLARAGAA